MNKKKRGYPYGVHWREPCTCHECGKEAGVSAVYGYVNVPTGGRVFCAHCGHHEE